MVIALCVIAVVVHRATVDAPVAGWPVLHIRGQVGSDVEAVTQNHLEPQIRPTQITNSLIATHFDLLGHKRRVLHNFTIHDVVKLAFPH